MFLTSVWTHYMLELISLAVSRRQIISKISFHPHPHPTVDSREIVTYYFLVLLFVRIIYYKFTFFTMFGKFLNFLKSDTLNFMTF